MKSPVLNELHDYQFGKSFLKKRFPEFVNYIDNNYPLNLKWTEKLYWWYYNIKETPLCPVCGSPLKFYDFDKGYRTYCSKKCANSCVLKNAKFKRTCLKKYGVPNPQQNDKIKEKSKQTCLEKYGVERPAQCNKIKEKSKQTCLKKYGVEYNFQTKKAQEKYKQTCLKKYGIINPIQCNKIKEKSKQTCLKKYGVPYISQVDEFKQKSYFTKRKNHTFCSSNIETKFGLWLINNNIKFEFQYKSNKYPFKCDFYFPDKQLYLEIQGNWVHGFHPFDKNNQNDINTLNKWKSKNSKYYESAIKTWTISDVKKRIWAKEHNLNWIEVFTNNIDCLIDKVKSLII